jgi:hypothetical protein
VRACLGLGPRLFPSENLSVSAVSLLRYCWDPPGALFAFLQRLLFYCGAHFSKGLTVAALLGLKLTGNELIALEELAQNRQSSSLISEKSFILAIYALCSFANLGTFCLPVFVFFPGGLP